MKKQNTRVFIKLVVMTILLMFAIASSIPIVGPSFVAYRLGGNRSLNYELSSWLMILSIIIGGSVAFVLHASILAFFSLRISWHETMLILGVIEVLNCLFAISFYFLGKYKIKNRKKIAMA